MKFYIDFSKLIIEIYRRCMDGYCSNKRPILTPIRLWLYILIGISSNRAVNTYLSRVMR